jgi:hypothetical protein
MFLCVRRSSVGESLVGSRLVHGNSGAVEMGGYKILPYGLIAVAD